MIAKCPNDPNHKRFITTAHVVEEWVVDKHGNWIDTIQSLETTHRPDKDNVWNCYECGAIAVFEESNK